MDELGLLIGAYMLLEESARVFSFQMMEEDEIAKRVVIRRTVRK